MNGIQHALSHFFGLSNLSGPFYGFWSGVGSDIGEISIFGALVGIYLHHRCTSCWRPARHAVEGTTYRTCHKHLTGTEHERLREKHAARRPGAHEMLNPTAPSA